MLNIFLIGMPGSGKSTTGKILAKKLALNFIDLDIFIEEKYNKKVEDIFEENGEDFFRIIERDCLDEILNLKNNFLLALGGGTPCFFNNMTKIKQNGFCIYLQFKSTELANRIVSNKNKRPLFKNLNEIEVLDKVKVLLRAREIFYSEAQLVINELEYDENKLVELIKNKLSK